MKHHLSFLFVASHVILRTVKAVPEYGKRKPRKSTAGGEGTAFPPFPEVMDDENANNQVF